MKKLSLVLALVLFAFGAAVAQRTVSGMVSDTKGEPLIGASILVKGTVTGTVTDFDGKYSIAVPAGSTTFVVSYTGFSTKEVEIGASSSINITLEDAAEQLSEVVVTGLGIRKEKKALGYAVTTLGSRDIELRPEADVSRVLRGKVPGVDISQTSGLAGSGTNVIIRGYSSITGTNQPLFVVDGIPFNSSTNADRGFDSGSASASSRFLDLDPNSIAEVSVLKGLSATVLYGEAGRNGVILITTKNGVPANSNKKLEITVNQSLYVNQIASLPEDQDVYGNGFDNFASAAFSNWGAPFDQPGRYGVAADGTIRHPYDRAALNSVFPQYVGARYAYKAYDNLQNFFTKGLINNTAINIASQLANNTTLNVSYAFRDDTGFIPQEYNRYTKHNLGLGLQTKLSNGFKISSTFNYVTSDRISPPSDISFSSGSDGSFTSLFGHIFYTPRSVGLYELEYENPVDKSSIFYRGGNDIQHTLWTLNNSGDIEDLSRFFGNMQVSYELTDWLTAAYRVGVDGYSQQQRYYLNKGGIDVPNGVLRTSNRSNTILDHLFSLAYDFRLSDSWVLDGVAGFNMRRDVLSRTFLNSSQQFVYGLFTHDNYIDHTSASDKFEENLMGAFLTASLGYKSFLYFNFQARNDWTSTLEKENRNIFYPSGSVSFIPTEAFAGLQNSNFLNYMKLRFGYGTSAGYPDPYQTRNVLATGTRAFVTDGGTVINTNSVSNVFGNPNLRPELHKELEFGLEARMFKNRLGIDLSLYNKNSSDLIIEQPLDPSTGGTSTTVNAASIRNRGIELGVDITPIQSKNFSWTLNANFTKNQGTVTELLDGVDQIVFSGYSNLGNFAIPGRPYGIILGTKMLRDDNGNPIVTSAGLYQSSGEIGELGDPNPNYLLNGGTSINFKGFSLSALLAYVDGGVIYATTPSTLMGRGVLQETGFDRFVPVIAPGVKADGTPNDIMINSTSHYWTNGGVFHDEMRTYDATYVKLREVSLGYSFPKKILEKTPFGSMTLVFSGQNLWFRALGVPKGANFDPEVSSLGVGNGRGFELMNVPTSKQFGGSLKFTF